MEELFSDTVSFPFKGPSGLVLGCYLPIYNIAIVHDFRNPFWKKIVDAHEIYSHPKSSYALRPSLFVAFCASKLLTLPNLLPHIENKWAPVLEGIVLASLFFTDRKTYDAICPIDSITRKYANVFIKTIESVLKWQSKSQKEKNALHPVAKSVLNSITCFLQFVKKGMQYVADTSQKYFYFAEIFGLCPFGEIDILEIINKHFEDPENNPIPDWVGDHLCFTAENFIKTWFLALLLLGKLIQNRNSSFISSLAAIGFFSAEFLNELRISEITWKGNTFAIRSKLITPLLSHTAFNEDLWIESKKLVQEMLHKDIPCIFPWQTLDLDTLPNRLLSTPFYFLPDFLRMVAKNIYFQTSRSYKHLDPVALLSCVKAAVQVVFDTMHESFIIWTNSGYAWKLDNIFKWIVRGARTSSTYDERLEKLNKLFDTVLEFLTQYSSSGFSSALRETLERSQYYYFNGANIDEEIKDYAEKFILIPNLKLLKLSPRIVKQYLAALTMPYS